MKSLFFQELSKYLTFHDFQVSGSHGIVITIHLHPETEKDYLLAMTKHYSTMQYCFHDNESVITHTSILRLLDFVWDYPGEPVPESNWILLKQMSRIIYLWQKKDQ